MTDESSQARNIMSEPVRGSHIRTDHELIRSNGDGSATSNNSSSHNISITNNFGNGENPYKDEELEILHDAALREFFQVYKTQLTNKKSMIRISRAYLAQKNRVHELPVVLQILELWVNAIIEQMRTAGDADAASPGSCSTSRGSESSGADDVTSGSGSGSGGSSESPTEELEKQPLNKPLIPNLQNLHLQNLPSSSQNTPLSSSCVVNDTNNTPLSSRSPSPLMTDFENFLVNFVSALPPSTNLQYIAIEGLLVAGCIAYALQDYQRALSLNQRILKLNPNHIQGLSNVAIVYRVLNRFDEGEYYWRRVVALRPTYWDAIEQLVALLTFQKRQQEAIELLSPALDAISFQKLQSPSDWSRCLSLYHTMGNLHSACGNVIAATQAFAMVVAMGCQFGGDDCHNSNGLGIGTQQDVSANNGIPDLIASINRSILVSVQDSHGSLLVRPQKALDSKYYLFSPSGTVPFPNEVDQQDGASTAQALNSVTMVISNALLNLAKILQDGVNSGNPSKLVYLNGRVPAQYDILSLYLLSLSLNPSPSASNNVGILLAAIANSTAALSNNQPQSLKRAAAAEEENEDLEMSALEYHQQQWGQYTKATSAEVRELAMEYYRYGLSLDPKHPHLYTNLGSLLREQGDTSEAIRMYQQAVKCDPTFNIALANLASALKDQGHLDQAVVYYRQAAQISPNFVEALSGLANCQGTICDWTGRGGYGWEPVSVDNEGNLTQGQIDGWLSRVVDIVDKQIESTRTWGMGVIEYAASTGNGQLFRQIERALGGFSEYQREQWSKVWSEWRGKKDEGSNVLSMIEKAIRVCQRRWYIDRLRGAEHSNQATAYCRPKIPSILPVPGATTILPFHAFTLPFNSRQVRQISELSALRVSMSTLTQTWIPDSVYPPPPPPAQSHDGHPVLHVGYISSDFSNHPLSHLMQSVFEMHNRSRVIPYCYATSASDGSAYRLKIQQGSVFRDVSSCSNEQIVNQIQADGIHVLINLNGFTRGARNEVFAVRPAPVQMSLMGFAGPIASDWNDFILADKAAVGDPTVYKERVMYMPRSFFCCDHRQSAHDSNRMRLLNGKELHTWPAELKLRTELRAKMFPQIPPNAFLMANFNQLYKIDPTTLRNWLVILKRVPNAYLWLLQFPRAGQVNLQKFALKWTGDESIVKRILFTPVAEKDLHIFRSRVCDLFLDTPECNAHTTAADVLWTGTPIVTFPRHEHKLCSRIASSIIHTAFPNTPEGFEMANRCIASSEEEYQEAVCDLASKPAELMHMRKVLWDERETGDFFNTQLWVDNVEKGYQQAWTDWVEGRHEDVYI